MYLAYRSDSAPSNGALSHGAIAGIVVAVVAFIAATTFGLWTYFTRRFKKTRPRTIFRLACIDQNSGPRPGPLMEIDTTSGLWTCFTRRFKKTRPITTIRLPCIDQNSDPRPGQRMESDTPDSDPLLGDSYIDIDEPSIEWAHPYVLADVSANSSQDDLLHVHDQSALHNSARRLPEVSLDSQKRIPLDSDETYADGLDGIPGFRENTYPPPYLGSQDTYLDSFLDASSPSMPTTEGSSAPLSNPPNYDKDGPWIIHRMDTSSSPEVVSEEHVSQISKRKMSDSSDVIHLGERAQYSSDISRYHTQPDTPRSVLPTTIPLTSYHTSYQTSSYSAYSTTSERLSISHPHQPSVSSETDTTSNEWTLVSLDTTGPIHSRSRRGQLSLAAETVDPRELEYGPNPVIFAHLAKTDIEDFPHSNEAISNSLCRMETTSEPELVPEQRISKRRKSDSNDVLGSERCLGRGDDALPTAPAGNKRRAYDWRSTQQPYSTLNGLSSCESCSPSNDSDPPSLVHTDGSSPELAQPESDRASSTQSRMTSPASTSSLDESTSESSAPSEGDQSLACTECDMSFRTFGQRREHQNRKHTRRFKCDMCDRAFNLQADLGRHERTVHKSDGGAIDGGHEESPLKCPNEGCKTADKIWDRKDNLWRHIVRCRKALGMMA
jgi:hypothetical protein